eukprot:TRINITY_DN37011_c0_g1_i1.p1 TRINITY_DN37011_c0_g1~~TRINITY_DN37011_c0_g1_i1.p1  ORF type:complete len:618 (-),score=50.67 TRINITY_DN37011_c0_g1_i1:3-1856(-)
MTEALTVVGHEIVRGNAEGKLLYADVGLSFWGGVDPSSGRVIDHHHPLSGASLECAILAIPNSRGSCTGSMVLLELLLEGKAPAAILLRQPDEIIALGVIVAQEIFGKSLPVVCLGTDGFSKIKGLPFALVDGSTVRASRSSNSLDCCDGETQVVYSCVEAEPLSLTAGDRAMLDGEFGKAAQTAMRILVRAAEVQGARELIDISQVHIDGCTYGHPGAAHPTGLRFIEELVAMGGSVRVPTTLNSLSVDQRRWRKQGVPAEFGAPASALGDAYVAMGATPSFTCAPYLLDTAPTLGEQIAWGESNAVVFANSVLGARTQKYADFLDICIALTGRAPYAGCHLDGQRKAKVVLSYSGDINLIDDSFWPTLGYVCGLKAETRVPAVIGLEKALPSRDNLKGFSAAFGTVSSKAMFHIVGITPEAPDLATALDCRPSEIENTSTINLCHEDFEEAWSVLNNSTAEAVELVALGNPHFSVEEHAHLAELCRGRSKHPSVNMVVTTGREMFERAFAAGHVHELKRFGVSFVTDTCWCMIGEPVVPPETRTLVTNSAKYAHYAPGIIGRGVRYANLPDCVTAASTGKLPFQRPQWISQQRRCYGTNSQQVLRLAYSMLRRRA